MYYVTQYPSSPGIIGLACSDSTLVGLWLPGQTGFAKDAVSLPNPGAHPILEAAARWLDRYFAGDDPGSPPFPLAPEGSEFRKQIWKLLLDVPYGQSTSYGELAQKAASLMGKPRMSAQAVGGAVGANPIAIIIPCHRCLGSGGRLTGYAGGLHLKRSLLALENIPYRE